MKLTDEQAAAVAQWVDAGKTLSEIQKELAAQFKIVLTYMDVRFLVDDLNLSLKDKAPAAPADAPLPTPAPAAAPQPPFGDGAEDFTDAPEPPPLPESGAMPPPAATQDAGAASGSVRVSVDRVMRPGSLVSGSVVFSDGETATWQLDQMGRLGLGFKTQGYRPSPADLQQFQTLLRDELEKSGGF